MHLESSSGSRENFSKNFLYIYLLISVKKWDSKEISVGRQYLSPVPLGFLKVGHVGHYIFRFPQAVVNQGVIEVV